MKKLKFAGGFLALALLPALSSHAAVVTTSADTYVQSTNGNTPPYPNFGTLGSMVVKNPASPNQFTRKPYMRFDLSSISEPFAAASLDLVVAINNSGGGNNAPNTFVVDVYGLNDGAAGQSWGETTIDWGNAPGNDTASGTGFLAGSTILLGTLNVAATDVTGTTVSFSSAGLLSFLNADTDDLVTIMLARTEGGSKNLTFYSKEFSAGVNAAELNITPIPEPGTAALTIVGLLSFAGLRRKR